MLLILMQVCTVSTVATGGSSRGNASPTAHVTAVVPPPVIRYVDKNNETPGDGTSWQQAYRTIQEAIDDVAVYGLGEVWVADGTYDEPRVSDPHADGVNTGSLVLRPGVHVYGGFQGSETSRDERDWSVNSAIISGATSRDGSPAYHVVVGSEPATLDGFVVTGGEANGIEERALGGGMFNTSVSPTIAHCVFLFNWAEYGGGIYNANGTSGSVWECVFYGNNALIHGAGMMNTNSCNPHVVDCTFEANRAGGFGGGVYEENYSASVVMNCRFKENVAELMGGGIAVYQGCLTSVVNCLFFGNEVVSTGYGGGALGVSAADPVIANNTITQNKGAGAAVFSNTDSTFLLNCILWSNLAGEVDGYPTISYSIVQGGYSGPGNRDADPLFVDPVNGDLRVLPGSPAIDAGTSYGAPSTDFLGTLRPQGLAYDMGAYEHVAATLRGVVKDGATGQGIPCAVVVVTQGTDATKTGIVDLNGCYQIRDLEPGDCVIEVYAPGYAMQSESFVLDTGTTARSFFMEPVSEAGGVRGVCVDDVLGQPVAGVRVDAFIANRLRVATTYTGACGRYQLSNLVAKQTTDFTLEFSSEGYETESEVVPVSPDSTAESNQELMAKSAIPGSVAGVVTALTTGLPIAGARVTAEGLGNVSADTSAIGVYTIAALPEGRYSVITSATGYESQCQIMDVGSLAIENVDFALRLISEVPIGDVNSDTLTDAVDVQLVINAALDLPCEYDCDLNKDNYTDAVDVQMVINCALGLN